MHKGERIGRGQTAEIFACGQGHVLKLFFSGRSAEQAAYEARVAQAVYLATFFCLRVAHWSSIERTPPTAIRSLMLPEHRCSYAWGAFMSLS